MKHREIKTNQPLIMDLVQVLHMNGSLSSDSYAKNSSVQGKVISMAREIWEDAITDLYKSMNAPHKLSVAELGCSCGPNTLFVPLEFIKIVKTLHRKLGRSLPEFNIYLNDLYGNDFNSIFQCLLPKFQVEAKEEVGCNLCFVSAVPGSFHGRLFGSNTLHFVHSSYSLMWLSKIPKEVELMNGNNICMARASPQRVIDAYYGQFQADFSLFLRCRSQEVLRGGRMVLTILGRKSDNPRSKESCYIWELLAISLRQMVEEGVIEEEKLQSFNIPQYTPSPAEVRLEVENEGSFSINRLEASEIEWAACGSLPGAEYSYDVVKCMRSVAEPLLTHHFGEPLMDQLFDKYREVIGDHMANEDDDTKFVNVTVSMTRLG